MDTSTAHGPIIEIDLDEIHFAIEIHTRLDRYISVEIGQQRVWEPFETRVFQALCELGGCVIDIGANLGWYSLIASARVGHEGKVLALEPEQINFELLTRNIVRNGASNVITKRVAVGNSRGMSQLFLSEDNLGDHRLFEGKAKRRSTSIEVTTLNELIDGLECQPTLIKCDTQGSELAVVQGLDGNRFDPVTCSWIVEFWPHGLAGMDSDPEQLLRWFDNYGYQFYEVSEGNPRLVKCDSARLMHRVNTDLNQQSQMFINLLLIHPTDDRYSKIGQFIDLSE